MSAGPRIGARPTLFDAVSARLPLFEDLPEPLVARLAAGGFGRGLLTGSLRARLRKAGFADGAALALAAPAELMAVRKIGPVRVDAIRAHLLGELARLVPGARGFHDREATDRRRLERLRGVPLARLPLDADLVERLGTISPVVTCADLASRPRAEIGPDLAAADLDRIAAALVRVLSPERPRLPLAAIGAEDEGSALSAHERAAVLRERDREWDEAAPSPRDRPGRTA